MKLFLFLLFCFSIEQAIELKDFALKSPFVLGIFLFLLSSSFSFFLFFFSSFLIPLLSLTWCPHLPPLSRRRHRLGVVARVELRRQHGAHRRLCASHAGRAEQERTSVVQSAADGVRMGTRGDAAHLWEDTRCGRHGVLVHARAHSGGTCVWRQRQVARPHGRGGHLPER